MNNITRLGVVGLCGALCAVATIVANSERDQEAGVGDDFQSPGWKQLANGYRRVAGESQQELTFRQVESVVRRHAFATAHYGRIEFGSVDVTGATALVQVLFFARDGEMCPVIYKLAAEHNSWKVVSVQRIWFVPRSRLLRGVKA
jgi:hypothetical protein